jgi:hypothetical protein
MREAWKVFSVVVLLFAAPAAAVAWADDHPNLTVRLIRYSCPVLCAVAVAIFLKIHFRRDEAPDYLRKQVGGYFNRDGFCFGVVPTRVGSVCVFNVYFQNQYENRCLGRIALRPARGFLLGRAAMESIILEVDCQPAAFGAARIPVPLPEDLQGRRLPFEVGASVEYPDGKGRQLRFADGIALRANSDFGNAFATALTVAGAFAAHLVYTRPATATIALPRGVAKEITEISKPEIETFWQLGDPPLSDTVR